MDLLAQVVVWLNAVANWLGGILLAPVAMLPGWLSATIIAVVTGVLLLWIFKHTSNQRAIKLVRQDIKASLLSLKLFKDNSSVMMRAQGRLFLNAFWLLVYALVPLLVMMVPVVLILAQMSLWYDARPLRVGESATVTVKLNGGERWPDVRLEPTDAVKVRVGPVRAIKQRELTWEVTALKPGYHELLFEIGGPGGERESAIKVQKELAITDTVLRVRVQPVHLSVQQVAQRTGSDDFMRLSKQRPAWDWADALLYPAESPFPPDSPVRSIEIAYPDRSSWTSGTGSWVIYWFVVSFIAALLFRKALKVNL